MLYPGLPLVRVNVTGAPGTGTFTLGSAVGGFLTPTQAGGVDGRTYNYGAEGSFSSGSPTKREVGRGVWSSGAGTLTRAAVIASTNSNALENFSAADAVVSITPLSDDFDWMVTNNSVSVALADAATVAVDWASGINFTLTLTASRILGNPTNGVPGTWRSFLITQPVAGTAVLTFGNQWVFPWGAVPVIATGASALTRLTCFCRSASVFEAYMPGPGLA